MTIRLAAVLGVCLTGLTMASSPTAAPCPCPAPCFVGETTVQTPFGEVLLAKLDVGVKVFTGSRYEPVLGFVHQLQAGSGDFFTLVHASGELRASGNHIVMVDHGDKFAADVAVGDLVKTASGPSRVISSRSDSDHQGMIAPLTASGLLVVDAVTASNYAAIDSIQVSHGASHAAFFVTRSLAKLSQSLHVGDFAQIGCGLLFRSILSYPTKSA